MGSSQTRIEPVPPVLAGGFFTVEPTREAQRCLFLTERLTQLIQSLGGSVCGVCVCIEGAVC